MDGLDAGGGPASLARLRALKDAGFRRATLTNGSARAAERLFAAAGIRNWFDLLLSVEDAPVVQAGKDGVRVRGVGVRRIP